MSGAPSNCRPATGCGRTTTVVLRMLLRAAEPGRQVQKRAGTCAGPALRIPAQAADYESAIVWRRQMITGSYAPEFCRMRTPQGDIRAPVFASNPQSPRYFAEAPLAETAAIVAAASGPPGTNREYLEQVAAQLLALQIGDDYIADLLRHVQRSESAHSGS